MKVLILAAGYGTRLYPLALNTSKALIRVNNKPIINFLIEKIEILKKRYFIKEIRVVVNDKFYKDFLIWKNKYKIKAEILNDGSTKPEDRLGAVKDIKFAIGGKGEDWLVLGADNLFEDNFTNFIEFALNKRPYSSIGLYDVKHKKEAMRFGIAALNSRKRIVKLREKPKNPFSTLASSCIYFFPKESLGLLDSFIAYNKNADAAGKYIEWLVEKSKVFGYTFKGRWIDIGHFDSLRLAGRTFN